ncbi:hypothetical protein BHE74_00009475 [Ensete ventricosum]|nr:hypothetical protein BHE74_00009475 [Ensete ventricosum]RZR89143.1 hypothetical protein BHM03_00016811 [Ensete ventricosum]
MTRSADNLPHFSPESDQAPSGDATKRPELAPSTSARSFPDPDTLFSKSIGSLREQLRLVNQRIDDVRKTLRMKDEHAEGPLHDSPFFEGNFLSSARPKPTATSLLGMRQKEEEHISQYVTHFTNEYVAVETLVAEKREDQKPPRVEPSRGPPSGLPRRRMERGEQTVPRPPNVLLNSTRTEIFLQI